MTTTHTSPPAIPLAIPRAISPAGTPTLDTDQARIESHERHVGVESTSPATKFQATPIEAPSWGTQDHSGGQPPSGDHPRIAAAVQDSPPAKRASDPIRVARAGSTTTDDGQQSVDTQARHAVVGVDGHPAPARPNPVPISGSLGLDDPLLVIAADALDDLERTRIANENRVHQLTRTKVDKDGIDRGFGLDSGVPAVAALEAIVVGIAKLEHAAELQLKRTLRKHPLGPWVKSTVGVGEKQVARLLAAVGDPYWNTLHDRPRTTAELRSYCGLRQDADGVAVTRKKGQKANWSATAKMRVYLVAKSCIRQLRQPCEKPTEDRRWAVHVDGCGCSPYRVIYDSGRVKYADAIHKVECKRCGPKGKPAVVGSELSDGHKEMRAIRLMERAILEDLWLAARDIHKATPADQEVGDSQRRRVGGGQAGSSTDHGPCAAQRRIVGAASGQDTP